MKNFVNGLRVLLISPVACYARLEFFVRVTEIHGENFDIEMWRYARELKRFSNIPGMNHEHIPNASAVCMGVPLEIDSVGWRIRTNRLRNQTKRLAS